MRRNDDAKTVRAYGDWRRAAGAVRVDTASHNFCGNRLIFGGKLAAFNPLEFEEIGNGAGRNS